MTPKAEKFQEDLLELVEKSKIMICDMGWGIECLLISMLTQDAEGKEGIKAAEGFAKHLVVAVKTYYKSIEEMNGSD
jgi:hypothetical protein